jgi:hypothetical protein
MPADTKAVNYQGVPTATDMEETLLPEPDDIFGYREVFMVDNEAPNRDGDSVEYPSLDDDFEGSYVEIEKGDPHPVAKLEYDGMVAGWQDYGFKFQLHDNDIQDSKVNLVMVNQRNQNEERMRYLDGVAGAVLEANYGPEVGTASTGINYDAFVDAETEMVSNGYGNGSLMWVISPSAWGELVKTDAFTSDTETFAQEFRADGVRRESLLGHPAQRVNTGPLAGDDGGAYLVDTSRYGWESPRRNFNVTRDRDDDERCYWYMTDGRIDWVPVDDDACVRILGGV